MTTTRPMRADARLHHERLLRVARARPSRSRARTPAAEEVARRAGVGIGTLYRHFPNRTPC